MGAGTIAPGVIDAQPAPPGDVDRGQVLRGREARGDDQRVDAALPSVDCLDRLGFEPFDRVRDQLEIGPVEGRVVVVREERPLAAEWMLWA